ncbi:MAG: hypothetical protein Q9211_006468 [Gyalolechia sp. 1 TL-2023]
MPRVNLLPGHIPDPAPDSQDNSIEDIRATPEVSQQTLVEVAEIQHTSIIGRSPQNSIVLHAKSDSFSPISWRHIRFSCEGGIWAVEDLGSASGTIVNGLYIQGRRRSSSVRSSSKRTLSSFQEIHYTFSAGISSSQGSNATSQGKGQNRPSGLTLRPNEINEIQVGGHRLIITPYLRLTSHSPVHNLDRRFKEWQGLFGFPESFWYCRHCKGDTTRVAVAKFAPVACELRACGKDDLEDFIKRKRQLKPLGNVDICLERILAIFDGNDEGESPFVASLLHMTARSLEQMIAENEVFEPCDVRDMLKELLTALSMHEIDHGSISKSTIFIDDSGQVHLRGFMRSAKLRRLGHDVRDLFEVFRSIIPQHPDHKFYRYLSEHFDSAEHAREHFPSPDAKFDEINWMREVYVHHKQSRRTPSLTYIAIGPLCDTLLMETPSQAANYIEKLRDLRRPRRPDVDFDHCTLHGFKQAFPERSHAPWPRCSTGQIPVLNLTGYGVFLECSRLRLWADRHSVEVFDRVYADYPFLDVVSDDESLNGSYVPGENVAEIVDCLKLPKDLFSSLPCQGPDIATRPKLLYYLNDLLVSVVKFPDDKISWLTSGVGEPSIARSGFSQLVNEEHEYPHIFKTVPRGLLDEFKSTIAHEPPLPPEDDDIPTFGFRNQNR